MADEHTPETEAAAWWGIAQNEIFPQPHRLGAALQALEFYGGEYEKAQAAVESSLKTVAGEIRGQEIAGHWIDEAALTTPEDILPDRTRVTLNAIPDRVWETRGVRLDGDRDLRYELVRVDDTSHIQVQSATRSEFTLAGVRLEEPIEIGQVVMYMGVMDHYRGYHFYVSRFRDLPGGGRRYDLSRDISGFGQKILEDVPRQAIQPLPAEEKD